MAQFLTLVLSFPTVPFTVAMGVVLLYWLFVILGVVGHDVLDGAGGGAKAATEAAAGAIKAAGDAATGAVKAVAGMKAASAHDHAGDTDGGLFSMLGLGKVPVTITFSSIVFFSWVASMFGRGWLGSGTLGGSAVMLGSLVLALFISAGALKPFARVFEPARAASRQDIVGHICTITSGKVNAGFGTATLADGGAGLLLSVVCAKDNRLADGDRAVIVQWDEAAQAFDVEPVDWLMPHEVEALKDPATARSVISSRVKAR
jgi:hypothetical protein